MKKIVKLICVILFASFWVSSCSQDSPSTPQQPDIPTVDPDEPDNSDDPDTPQEPENPEKLPHEMWDFSFNNYVNTGCSRDYCAEKGRECHRTVVIARGKENLYIKGIFLEYPDSWIKGTVKGKELSFENGQVLEYENGKPIYFNWGTTCTYVSSGNTYNSIAVIFETKDPIPLEISKDGKTMSVDLVERKGYDYYNGAFWYNDVRGGGEYLEQFTRYCYTEYGQYYEEVNPFPERDFMINMCFKKLE